MLDRTVDPHGWPDADLGACARLRDEANVKVVAMYGSIGVERRYCRCTSHIVHNLAQITKALYTKAL